MVSRYVVRDGKFAPETPRPWGTVRLDGLPTNRLFDLHPDGKRIIGMMAPAGDDPVPPGHVTFLFNFADELQRLVPANP
jgi:hypothetical protein